MSCPELAAPVINVTRETMSSILLSTYAHVVGIKVKVECLMPEAYTLVGDENLTCLPNSTWDKPRPHCELDKGFLDRNTNPTTAAPPIAAASSAALSTMDITAIVIGVVSALILLVLILLLCRAWRARRREMEREHVHRRSFQDEYGNPRHLQPRHTYHNQDYWRPDFMRADYNSGKVPYVLPKATIRHFSRA